MHCGRRASQLPHLLPPDRRTCAGTPHARADVSRITPDYYVAVMWIEFHEPSGSSCFFASNERAAAASEWIEDRIPRL